MTIGSPRRFISASRGSVMGSRDASAGTWTLGCVDMVVLLSLSAGVDALRNEGRHLGVDVEDLVGWGLHVHDARLVLLDLRPVVLPIGDDDDRVAAVHEARRG